MTCNPAVPVPGHAPAAGDVQPIPQVQSATADARAPVPALTPVQAIFGGCIIGMAATCVFNSHPLGHER